MTEKPAPICQHLKPKAYDHSAPCIVKQIEEIFADVPDSEWETVPKDGSHRHNFYLYGVDTTTA